MLDSHIRPFIDPPLNYIAQKLVRCGVSANMLTAIGFIFALVAFAALFFQNYNLAIIFIVLNRLIDGLDGPLARQTKATDLGGFYDIVSDFIFYAGIVFFFALGQTDFLLPAAFLLFSFIGTTSSFLAYAIIAAKRSINTQHQGKKSFYYLGGLTEGTETIMVLLLICIIPNFFAIIAYVYGALCWITTVGRIIQARSDFKE